MTFLKRQGHRQLTTAYMGPHFCGQLGLLKSGGSLNRARAEKCFPGFELQTRCCTTVVRSAEAELWKQRCQPWLFAGP